MKRILYQSAVLCLCLVLILPFLFSCTRADSDLIGRWETEIVDEELGKFSMVYHFTEEGEIFLEQKKGAEIPFSIPFGMPIRSIFFMISKSGLNRKRFSM